MLEQNNIEGTTEGIHHLGSINADISMYLISLFSFDLTVHAADLQIARILLCF
jgi:hypothetical protein